MDNIAILNLEVEPVLSRYHQIKDYLAPSFDFYCHRYVCPNDPVIRQFFLDEVHPWVEELLGFPVQPSYCYLSRYVDGTALHAHVDRAMCWITVSHTIHCDPPKSATEWMLYIEGTPIGLQVGQAVMFNGLMKRHWRNNMPPWIHEYVNVYYHFAATDYTGPLE